MFLRSRNFFERSCWVMFGLVVLLVLLMGKTAMAADVVSESGKRIAPIRWLPDDLIKIAIVSALRVQMDHPKLQTDEPFMRHLDDTMHLILVFSSLDSPHSLETLASLSSYALPEADSNIYMCVMINKGAAILPFLQHQLQVRAPNECIDKFGKQNTTGVSPGVSLTRQAMCLNDVTKRQLIETTIHEIREGRRCDVDEIQW